MCAWQTQADRQTSVDFAQVPTEHPNRSAYAKPQSRTGLHIEDTEDFQLSAPSISHKPRIYSLGRGFIPLLTL